jgi:hypothetical protein
MCRRTGRDVLVTSEKLIFIERQSVRLDGKNVGLNGLAGTAKGDSLFNAPYDRWLMHFLPMVDLGW